MGDSDTTDESDGGTESSTSSDDEGQISAMFANMSEIFFADNEEQIKRELKEQPGRLQFLYGIVTDLFLDKFKFKGQNVSAQAPQLQRLLAHDYSLPNVLQFFEQQR